MKYILSHKTFPVLSMEIDEATGVITKVNEIISTRRLPICISFENKTVNLKSLNTWWARRSIPARRSGLHYVLETLHIPTSLSLLTKCYGLSLSDQYWVYPEVSNIRWQDVNFFENAFSYDVGNILFGKIYNKTVFDLMSPDNTTSGLLQKKWIINNEKRLLIKGGSGAIRQEPYNEVLATKIMEHLNVPHVSYTLSLIDEYPYSVCEGFITKDTELVTALQIVQTQTKPEHTSLYQHFLNCCNKLGIPDVTENLNKMLTLDYIIVNSDRHLNNFGVVRNASSLKWMGLAPVYNSGTSMWCNEPTTLIKPVLSAASKPFRSNHSEQINLIKSFKWLNLSKLQGINEEYQDILADSGFIDKTRRDLLCDSLNKRIEQLNTQIQSRIKEIEKSGYDEKLLESVDHVLDIFY